MSCSTKRTAWLAFAGLAILGAMAAPAHAQRGFRPQPYIRGPLVTPYPVNPNGFTGAFPTAQQALFNSRVIGRSIANVPPYAFGYNPYPSPILNSGPISPYPAYPTYPTTPYATLSTSPYGAGYGAGSTLSTSPYGGGGYGLSTTPYGGGGYGAGSYDPTGLQGFSSYVQAEGNYKIQIQQARLVREQARQANIDTARKRLMWEMEYYEKYAPSATRMRDAEMATALDQARKDPPAPAVWSGGALNELLRSIKKTPRNKLKDGPQIDLSDVNLDGVNLTDKSGQGNTGLLKAETKDGKLALYWPVAFETPGFSEPAKQLSQSLGEAVASLKKKERPATTTMKDVQSNYKMLNDKIAASATTDELSMSQSIEARRYMRQLDQAIKALNDPKASNYFDDWKAKGKTVAELVDHMMKTGLEFAPAASGDEASYTALYQALRAFEAGLQPQATANQK